MFGRQMIGIQTHIAFIHTDEFVVSKLVIRLNSRFKVVWNLFIAVLLLYTSLWVPYQIAFIDDTDSVVNDVINIVVDVCFAADIIITFLSSYETHLGREETRLKIIARNYLTGWFLIDLLATIPT
jgi:hypothetical protein